jgi:hypothetical protein
MNEHKIDRFQELARALADRWHREGKLGPAFDDRKDVDGLAYVIKHGRFPNGWGELPLMRTLETVVSPAGVEFTVAEGAAGGRLMFPSDDE